MGYATGRAGVTPTLDALAASGTWFAACQTCVPITLPSHTSIMTGLYPPHHGVRNNGTPLERSDVITLAARMRDAGYSTHAIVASFVLDGRFGLDRGFESYDDNLEGASTPETFLISEIDARRVTDKAVKWIRDHRSGDRPFFLWLHFFDPHSYYEPPADVKARFPDDPYTGEIHYADRELGRVIAELREGGTLSRTVIVFTADHGESLGEHGEKTHGVFLYAGTMHVPLLIAGGGVPRGRRVDGVARTVDLVPTILDLLDLPRTGPFDGKSLRPLWDGAQETRLAYMESFMPRLDYGWAELRGVCDARMKAIEAPRPELYDLGNDPSELNNLLLPGAPATNVAGPLFDEITHVRSTDSFDPSRAHTDSADSEAARKLASLGYVGGAGRVRSGDLADPKDRIELLDRLETARQMIQGGQAAEAKGVLDRILAGDPLNVIAMTYLAEALTQTGDLDQAVKLYRRIVTVDPELTKVHLPAAAAAREAGDFAAAEEFLRKLLAVEPENPEATATLARLYLDQHRKEDADRCYREALPLLRRAHEAHPNRQSLTWVLAMATEQTGDLEEALKLYRWAVQLDPSHAKSWNNMGALLVRMGRKSEAIEAVTRAHELDAGNVDATFNLGVLLFNSGESSKALALLEEALRQRPDHLQAALFHAHALTSIGRRQEALAEWRALADLSPLAALELARLELSMGDGEQAREDLRRALARWGENFRRRAMEDPNLRTIVPARATS